MALLPKFSAPGNLPDLPDPDGWSKKVGDMFAGFAGEPRFFNPLDDQVTGNPRRDPVFWPAFPGTLTKSRPPDRKSAEAADLRSNQDEYCEWAVQRNEEGTITSVTFTTETPEHFEHLLATDPDAFNALYKELTGRVPDRDEIGGPGDYNALNSANMADGQIAHLSHESNKLGAAVSLVAVATALRFDNNGPVTAQGKLAKCAGLGAPKRNSDPQIAKAVNDLARDGRTVSLNDPPGLYLHGFSAAGLVTEDGTDPATFWQPLDRGEAGHVMRARFSVPEELKYKVGDIELDGEKIRFGSQLASLVQVRIEAMSMPSDQPAREQPCQS